MNKKPLFSVIQRYQSVLVNSDGAKLRHPNMFVGILNCTLMEKFSLYVCPAHEGGVYGEEVELVNLGPIGLRNNLNYLSAKAQKVLNYYEKLLQEFFSKGVLTCPSPCYLFDADNVSHANYFLKIENFANYITKILIQVEAEADNKKSFLERFRFSQSVLRRFQKETELSLLSPYLTGFKC